MLAPQQPLDFKFQLWIIYAGQIFSRLVFYGLAFFPIAGIPRLDTPLPESIHWGLSAGAIAIVFISEWMHNQGRRCDPRTNPAGLKAYYIASWALSELLAVAGLILIFFFQFGTFNHGLFMSSLFLGLWQFPRPKSIKGPAR